MEISAGGAIVCVKGVLLWFVRGGRLCRKESFSLEDWRRGGLGFFVGFGRGGRKARTS